MEELNKILEIETKLSTLFCPQTDGQMERMKKVQKETEAALRKA